MRHGVEPKILVVEGGGRVEAEFEERERKTKKRCMEESIAKISVFRVQDLF